MQHLYISFVFFFYFCINRVPFVCRFMCRDIFISERSLLCCFYTRLYLLRCTVVFDVPFSFKFSAIFAKVVYILLCIKD